MCGEVVGSKDATNAPSGGKPEAAPALNPRVRNLRKKLGEITALEQRVAMGTLLELTAEQAEKIARRLQLEEELSRLLPKEEEVQVTDPVATVGNSEVATGSDTKDAVAQRDQTPPRTRTRVPRSPLGPKVVQPLLECEDEDLLALQPMLHRTSSLQSQRWEDDPVSVEDVLPTPKAVREPKYEFIEEVKPFSAAVLASEWMQKLVRGVSELSCDAFEEDALEMVTKRGGWKLTLLACPESLGRKANGCVGLADVPLIGFVVYRIRPELQSLSIAKLAIVPEHRRNGHGCRLIDWCMAKAKRTQGLAFIALSSLPEAVRFYQRLGFKQHSVTIRSEDDEELVEGQVYMEKMIRGKAGRRR